MHVNVQDNHFTNSLESLTMRYFLGSDIGTSGCKSIIINEQGQMLSWALASYRTERTRPGWAEHHPRDWFTAFVHSSQLAMSRASIGSDEIDTLCVVGITHNAVLLDDNGQVVRPSILYTDTRSDLQSKRLTERFGGAVFARTQNAMGTLWTWPQLLWIKEHEPEKWARVAHILFPKDYIRHLLAPGFITDHVDPVGSLLYDPLHKDWVPEFLQTLDLNPGMLPRVQHSLSEASFITDEGAARSGLNPGTRIITGTTDTAAEVIGTGLMQPGQVIVKLATVGRIMGITDRPLPHPTFLNYPHVVDGLWYPGNSTKFGASALKWALSALWQGGDTDLVELNRAVAQIPAGSHGLLFHPYLDGAFTPVWDKDIRASFLGLHVNHTRAHMTRAVMEGVAFSIRNALSDATQAGLGPINEIRLIGGGARSDPWAQIMSDVLNQSLKVPEAADAAYGAALMAAASTGAIELTTASLESLLKMRAVFEPITFNVRLYEDLFNIYLAAIETIKPISHKLGAIDALSRSR